MTITAIDPGATTGVAILKNGYVQYSVALKHITPTTILARFLCDVRYGYDNDDQSVVIEVPDSWTRDGKNVGAVLGVNAIAYTLFGWYSSQEISCLMVPVSAWKGTKTKAATLAELHYILKAQGHAIPEKITTHEADAIRLGIWYDHHLSTMRRMTNV